MQDCARLRYLIIPGLALAVFACSKGNSTGPTAVTTTTTSIPANRPPSITSVAVSPTNGIATLTVHNFTAAATDPDGDPISYSWNFGGGITSSSQNQSVTYNNANTTTFQAVVTVTDSKGASSTGSVSVTSATIAGTFSGTVPDLNSPITVTLTQFLGGVVTGTWTMASLGYSGQVGPQGEAGTINAQAAFNLRFKVLQGRFDDFRFIGTMDPTGQRLTGNLTGSGFTGQIMTLLKQ